MDVVTAITRDDRDIRGLLELLRDSDHDLGPLLERVQLRLAARDVAQEVHLDPELLRVEPAVEAMLRDRVRAGQNARALARDAESAIGSSRFDDARSTFIDTVVRHMASQESILLPAVSRLLPIKRRRELGRQFELRRLAELEVHAGDNGAGPRPSSQVSPIPDPRQGGGPRE